MLDLSFESDENNDDDNIQIEIAAACERKDDEVLTTLTTDIPNQQRKRNKFKWTIHSEWDDLDKALEFLEDEGFINYDYSDLKCGLKFYFRCKLVPSRRKIWCSKRYTLYLPSKSKKIQILRSEFDHDHEKILEGTDRPPSGEIREFILDLFKCGTTKISDVIRCLDYAREKKGFSNQNLILEIDKLSTCFRNIERPKCHQ